MATETPVKGEKGVVAREIARAAAKLFASTGYDATSVQMIVKAAGVTKPTLYYHFGSKEGLAQALVTVPMTELIARLRAIVESPADPGTALEQMLEAHFAFCRDDPDRSRFVYALFFGPLGSGLAAELARFGQALHDVMAEGIRRLAEDGRIATARVDACTVALRGLLVISTMDYLYHGGDLGAELARRLVGDLLRGFEEPRTSDRGCRS